MAFIVADRVKETSTTTGTGALTLAGAATGFKTFASRCAVGDTLYYAIQAVDGLGAPTGEWECGLGTYSGVNTLTRTTVTSSSAADAAVSFSAGTKQVYITMPAVQVAWAREKLTANRTYYVRPDGSDSNTGLADTAGGAFLTVQKAVDTICQTLSLRGFTVTVQIADGTYTSTTTLRALPDDGTVVIQGNSGTPANVLISTTSANCFNANLVRTNYTLKDLKVQTTTSGTGIQATYGAQITITNVVFGACVGPHVYCDRGAIITFSGAYSITGGASVHCQCDLGGIIVNNSKTITLTGTPLLSTAFAYASGSSMVQLVSVTYSGSANASGPSYGAHFCGAIQTSGNMPPGSGSGTTSTGGVYA